ncbi:MAG: TonB family protein [Acidobacteriota bacterium]|nr:TonB family protein [Acidobacteriota bacterium]MDQ7087531.1 TonB family protein [Acidobacteriota bacterium]
MRVRLRILLPSPMEAGSVGISLAAHLLLITAVFVAGSRQGLTGPPPPAMVVRLAAARPATPAKPRAARPAAATRAARPVPKPRTPPRKAPRRRQADAPRTVVKKPRGVTAQPETLPVEKETPPPPSPEPAPETPPPGPTDGTPIPGGVAGLETDEPFTADWYVGLITARLGEAWRDRPVLPSTSAPRRVVIAFTIDRSGTVSGARVHVPSGYAPLDFSALRAVRSLGRLPPLPRSYERESLSARFVFELIPSGP